MMLLRNGKMLAAVGSGALGGLVWANYEPEIREEMEKNIPPVFSHVYEPLGLGIIKEPLKIPRFGIQKKLITKEGKKSFVNEESDQLIKLATMAEERLSARSAEARKPEPKMPKMDANVVDEAYANLFAGLKSARDRRLPYKVLKLKENMRADQVDGYAFGKKRSEEKPALNWQTVSILKYPFGPVDDNSIPPGIGPEEYRLALAQAEVYLVGFAPFSKASCVDVRKTVEATQPDFVLLDMTPSHVSLPILSMNAQTMLQQTQSYLTIQRMMAMVRQDGMMGLIHVFHLFQLKQLIQQSGSAPGDEVRAAYNASKHMPGCQLVLAGQPPMQEIDRKLNSLGFSQKMKYIFSLPFSEKNKHEDMKDFFAEDLDESDKHRTQVLLHLMHRATVEKLCASKKCKAQFEPVTIVAVVHSDQVKGICANWARHMDGNNKLPTIPPSSLTAGIRPD